MRVNEKLAGQPGPGVTATAMRLGSSYVHVSRLPRALVLACVLATANVALAAAAEEGPRHLGGSGCQGCHSTPPPAYDRDLALLNEATYFHPDHPQDRHALAYQALEGPLGKKILATLGIDLANLEQARACLSCHAGWQAHEAEPPPGYDLLGVSCEACHGPSSQWDVPHRDKHTWRKLPAAEKAAKGFVNVREPRQKIQQCLACHLGDHARGTLITHEMYAAGHPPLGNFEYQAFAEQLPRHWRTLNEKGEFDHRDAYVRAALAGEFHGFPATQDVAVGGLITLRQAVSLLVEQARAAEARPATWPELAHFDCQACHHELSSDSWRTLRPPSPGLPGRPELPLWAAALAPASLSLLPEGEREPAEREFAAAWQAFRTAAKSQPFGNPSELVKSGETLLAVLDKGAGRLATQNYSHSLAVQFLARLLSEEDANHFDFHSARQIAWGARGVRIELETKYPQFTAREPAESAAARRARHQRDVQLFENWRREVLPQFAAQVDEALAPGMWHERLALRLPAAAGESYETAVEKRLAAAAAYDPAWFRQQLKQLDIRELREK